MSVEAEIVQHLETIRMTLAVATGILLAIFGLLAIKLQTNDKAQFRA